MATAIGYAGGGKISALIDNYVEGNLVIFLSFAVMSMAIAFTQWLVIRRHIRGMSWLWMTLIGGTLGGLLSSWASFQLAITYGDAVDFLLVYGCLRGLTTGFAQWFLLKQSFKHSGWWVVGTTASWYVSVLVGSLMIQKLGYFLTLTVGAIYGLLTGIVLLLLFCDRINSFKKS